MKLGRNFNCFCLSLFLPIERDSQKTVFKLCTYCILVDIFWKGESSSKAIGLTFSYKPFCFVFLFITGFYQVFFWLFYFFFAFLMGLFFTASLILAILRTLSLRLISILFSSSPGNSISRI